MKLQVEFSGDYRRIVTISTDDQTWIAKKNRVNRWELDEPIGWQRGFTDLEELLEAIETGGTK